MCTTITVQDCGAILIAATSFYEGNTVIGNYAAGIMYEISVGGTIIRKNVANDNGTTNGHAQIFVSSSNGTQVYGNNVRSSGSGGTITMQANNRPDALSTANNSFHDNIITFTTNNGNYALPNYSGLVGTGNSSDYNSFFVANTADLHWMWNSLSRVSWSQYRSSSGQDAGSTLQVGNGSVSGNTSGCPALTGCATDQQVPSVPVGLSGTAVSTSQVNLSWLASTDNVGVASYNVFRNGVKIGTVNGTSFSDL